jgi:integrase
MSAPLRKTSTPGIYRRGSRYSVVYRDPGGKQRKRSARTLAEARDLKSALRADIARGEYRALSRVTFAEYASEWLESYTGRTSRGVREATLRDYRRVMEKRAIPFFARLRLAEIEPRDVKRYVTSVAAEGLSRNTIRLALAPVRALFATALEEGLIRSNPATGIRLPRQAADEAKEEDSKALTEEELGQVIAASPLEWRTFVRFLAETGLRVGEAIALRWSDVDLGRRRVKVSRRFYKGDFAPPKSRYGKRTVPLSVGLGKELWLRRGSAGDDALVFPSRHGGVVNASTAFRAVQAAGKAAGIERVGPHTLRHSCATRLFRNGLNAKQVQLWLGHHSPAFTLATYVHLLADDLPEVDFLDELAGAWGQHGGSGTPESGRSESLTSAAETAP